MDSCVYCGESYQTSSTLVSCLLGKFQGTKTLDEAKEHCCEEFNFFSTYDKEDDNAS